MKKPDPTTLPRPQCQHPDWTFLPGADRWMCPVCRLTISSDALVILQALRQMTAKAVSR